MIINEKTKSVAGNNESASETFRTGGLCRRCGKEHWLGPGNTSFFCRELMDRLDRFGTIDLFSSQPGTGSALDTTCLFGPARGKMFGVMECLKTDGTNVLLYSFSGQYNGRWLVDGWSPPLFGLDDYFSLTVDREKQIKQLGLQIDRCSPHSSEWLAQRKTRRLLSRNLMRDIHSLYKLHNFRGEIAGLDEAFIGDNGIPTGTGDCCAPKLLDFAAQNNLHPLGMSEFFWGKENRSGEHQHGALTSSCVEKCRPILGFMLCGLEERSPAVK